MKRRVTWIVAAALAIGILAQPAAASDIPNDAGYGADFVMRRGTVRTGCEPSGLSTVSGSSGESDPNYRFATPWPFFEMGNTGVSVTWAFMDGAWGDLKLCGRLREAPLTGGEPIGNPGRRCMVYDAKGTIRYGSDRGNKTYWLRNVRSHGDVQGSVHHLVGDVVVASSAAAAAAMTPHHYIHLQIPHGMCYGVSAFYMNPLTYQIVDRDAHALPPLCETHWTNGCLYGPGPL